MERAHIADFVFDRTPAFPIPIHGGYPEYLTTRPPPTPARTSKHHVAHPRGRPPPAPRIHFESNPETYQTLLGERIHPPNALFRPAATADHPLVTQSRSLLPILAAISLFGASLAFGTFFTAQQTYPAQSRTLAYLSWSFAAFVWSMLSTLIWQVVLASNFRDFKFEGRLFRSKTAILCAFFAAFSSIAAGVILLGLALTEHTAPGVRAAGLCTVAAVVVAVFAAMIRLCMTVVRRARTVARASTPSSRPLEATFP